MPYKDKAKQLEAQKRHYYANKSRYVNSTHRRRIQRANFISDYKHSKTCVVCGECEPCCLVFHHTDPTIKDDNISQMVRDARVMDDILKEIEKCVVMCHNCHRRLHNGSLVLPDGLAPSTSNL